MRPSHRFVGAATVAALHLLAGNSDAIRIVELGLDNHEWDDPNCVDFSYRQLPVRCKAGFPDCADPASDDRGEWEVIPPNDPGYPIAWDPGDAINTKQCRIKPPPPPGPGDPATPDNDPSHGYQLRLKWCLGQTKMVTDERFADRITHFFPDDPGKDTWSLRSDVDCDGLEGKFAGWVSDDEKRGLADEFRDLAGMPAVCRPENDANGNGRIDLGECETNRFFNAGEQEACHTLALPDFPHTVVGYKFYGHVGSHHFLVWELNHSCNGHDFDSDATGCYLPDQPLGGGEATWDWDTKSCGSMEGNVATAGKVGVTGAQKPEAAVPYLESGPGYDADSDSPFLGIRMGRNHVFWPSTHVLNKSYPQWESWRSTAMETWVNVYTADPTPPNPAEAPAPTPPQYNVRAMYGFLTGLTTFTPPYAVGVVQGAWIPPRWPSYVFSLTGHAHSRTTLFTSHKTPVNADTGHPDEDCRGGLGPVYRTTTPQEAKWCSYGDVADSDVISLDEGEGLQFQCWTNNGMNAVNAIPDASVRSAVLSAAPQLAPRPLKWTCEQIEGVTPGLPVVQAVGVATTVPCNPDDPTARVSDHQPDAECCEEGTGPGSDEPCDPIETGGTQGTGHCVPGHVTWGYSSDDEMCLFLGMFYDLGTGVSTGWPEASP